MITSIKLDTIPFIGTQTSIDSLKKINYFYGGNGSGKTTISRVINNPSKYQNCIINWKDEQELETLVYNRDFMDSNYDEIQGVFTLGKESKVTKQKIKDLENEIKKIDEKIIKYRNALEGTEEFEGKEAELVNLKKIFTDRCWDEKVKYDKFKDGFKGYNDSRNNFFRQIIIECDNNEYELLAEEDLEHKINSVFSKNLTKAEEIRSIDFDELLSISKEEIWTKPIVGKKDIGFANLIRKLQNSDWVKKGLDYYESSEQHCPFCQQTITDEIERSLEDYFDEAFLNDSKRVNKLASTYSKAIVRIKKDLEEIITIKSKFVDHEQLKKTQELFESIIRINQRSIDEKINQLNAIIKFEPIKEVADEINKIISDANSKINENNYIVDNREEESTTTKKQTWRFIVDKLQPDLDRFKKKEENLNKSIKGLKESIDLQTKIRNEKEAKLEELQTQLTSIIPTRDSINKILVSFGFKNFKLEVIQNTNGYKLVREDGCDAIETLSDGEKNFVSFLYFYYRLKGNKEKSGIPRPKIVVIDDPVSSLDSEVLFIVSTLIRKLLKDIEKEKGDIKQIFVLSHNTYFHKEVSYDNRRDNGKALNYETFWHVKKQEKYSIVEMKLTNPIKTTYELLWEEVKSPNRNNATIQNTLRRIIENYFKLAGGMNLDETYGKANDENKVICRSLCSWMHDGSHNAFGDEHYSSFDDEAVDKFLDVFRYIFKINGQIGHYNMMMGIESKQEEFL